MGVVDLGDADVASPESQARLSFPFLVEAVDLVELDRAERVDHQPNMPPRPTAEN